MNLVANGLSGQILVKRGSYQVQTNFSLTIYLDLAFTPVGKFVLTPDYGERAIYTVTEGIDLDGEELEQHRLVIYIA